MRKYYKLVVSNDNVVEGHLRQFDPEIRNKIYKRFKDNPNYLLIEMIINEDRTEKYNNLFPTNNTHQLLNVIK